MPQSSLSNELLAFSDRFLTRARIWHDVRIFAHLLILVFAVLESYHAAPGHMYAIGLLFATGFSILASLRYRRAHLDLREYRLHLLLVNSLGLSQTILATRIKMLSDGASIETTNTKPHPRSADNYYSSGEGPGVPRLRENLAETLYFATQLYRSSSSMGVWLLSLPGIIAILLLLVAPYFETTAVFYGLDRILILSILFLNEIHIVNEVADLRRASDKTQQLLHQLEHSDERSFATIIYATAAYCQISAFVPAPSAVAYRRNVLRIGAMWREYRVRFLHASSQPRR